MRAAPEAVESVGGALLEQGMPVEEVRSILDADDPAVVRRHLELHRERLAERLEERLRTVDRMERLLLERTEAHPRVENTSINVAANSSGRLEKPPWSPGKGTGSIPSSAARARALRAGT